MYRLSTFATNCQKHVYTRGERACAFFSFSLARLLNFAHSEYKWSRGEMRAREKRQKFLMLHIYFAPFVQESSFVKCFLEKRCPASLFSRLKVYSEKETHILSRVGKWTENAHLCGVAEYTWQCAFVTFVNFVLMNFNTVHLHRFTIIHHGCARYFSNLILFLVKNAFVCETGMEYFPWCEGC